MQRKPSFPVANCSIKMPECNMPTVMPEAVLNEEDSEQQQRRQQLINFGHSQWGFNNWSWSVTKQELDFVDFNNGKYCVGVVSFVSITVKSFDIHRENIGYATSVANSKGIAIYKSRKCAVTNALRETLLSFGGSVATELTELLLESNRADYSAPANAPELLPENNQNIINRPTEPKNSPLNRARKEPDSQPTNILAPRPIPTVKNVAPVAKAHPMPANLPQPVRPTLVAPRPPAAAPRPNSNDIPKSFEGMSDEEARAERKRRQRQAQEEFRQRQMMKQGEPDDKPDLSRNSSSFDKLLMDIPTQEIVIEASGADEAGKRKSPAPDGGAAKRRGSVTRLDIVQTD